MTTKPKEAIKIQNIICCPTCSSKLTKKNSSYICKKCSHTYPIINNNIVSFITSTSTDKLTNAKWQDFYLDDSFNKKAEEEYIKYFRDDINKQILKYSKGFPQGKIFMDAGCGYGLTGESMAKEGWFFVGVDYSITTLINLNKRLIKHKIKNFILIHADILSLPLRANCIDLVWSGGVLEHIKDYSTGLNSIYRCLKRGCYSNIAVPSFNIGNLIYRSQWGGIPNVPILKQLAEFIHIRLLKGKHMVFGYELQFTKKQLLDLHINSGYKKNKVTLGRLECMPQVHSIKIPALKMFFRRLCETNENFWPMVVVVGFKS